MQRLSENQITHRVGQVLRNIGGLHPDDQQEILQRCGMNVKPRNQEDNEINIDDPQLMNEKLMQSVLRGLDSGNAQMARVALDLKQNHAGKDYLSDLTINIMDYRIKDSSLAHIISEADDTVLAEVETALRKRRAGR